MSIAKGKTLRTIILYASNYGTVVSCVARLKDLLQGEITTVDLRHQKVPSLNTFDTIIIGGSIRAGKIQRVIKHLCAKHAPELLTKRLGLFLCCMEEGAKAQQQFETAYPAELRKHAAVQSFFGGAFYFERMNWLERIVIRKISGISTNVSRINDSAIVEFAQKMTQ